MLFVRPTLFISDHFMDWAARKGIKLELYTAYNPHIDSQSEIASKAMLPAVWECMGKGNEWLHTVSKIQLKLISWDNTTQDNTGHSFTYRLGGKARSFFLTLPDQSLYLCRGTSPWQLTQPILLPSQVGKTSQQEGVRPTTSCRWPKGSSLYWEHQLLEHM